MKKKFKANSFIVEVGSNDGIFLKNFANKNFKHLGVDASQNVCDLARKRGVNTLNGFLIMNYQKNYRKLW